MNRISYIERYDKIVSHIKGINVKVLDIGCRDGVLGTMLNYTMDYQGIDIIPVPSNPRIKQVDVDRESLPFESDTFDYVVLSEVLEHLVNVNNCLSEAYRVLKPFGTMIGTVPNSQNIDRMIHSMYDVDYKFTNDHFCSYDIDEIERLLNRHKFHGEVSNFYYTLPKLGEVAILGKVLPRCSVYLFFKVTK